MNWPFRRDNTKTKQNNKKPANSKENTPKKMLNLTNNWENANQSSKSIALFTLQIVNNNILIDSQVPAKVWYSYTLLEMGQVFFSVLYTYLLI